MEGEGEGGGTEPGRWLSAETILYLIICKRDKGKSTERLRNEDVCDFSVLQKELPEVICGHVFCATTNKHFAAS